MFGDHGLCGLLEEGAHGKSPKCLDGNLGDFGEFCKGLRLNLNQDKATKPQTVQIVRQGEATPYWFKVNPLYFSPIRNLPYQLSSFLSRRQSIFEIQKLFFKPRFLKFYDGLPPAWE